MTNAIIEKAPATSIGHQADGIKGPKCCICGCEIPIVVSPEGHETRIGQNNPAPIINDDESVCCNDCNALFVIPARMGKLDSNGGMLYALAARMREIGCTDEAVRGVVDLTIDADYPDEETNPTQTLRNTYNYIESVSNELEAALLDLEVSSTLVSSNATLDEDDRDRLSDVTDDAIRALSALNRECEVVLSTIDAALDAFKRLPMAE